MKIVPRRVMLLALSALAYCPIALAQAWPAKPLRIINHQPPGGPSDSGPRLLQSQLGPIYGVPIVIENRTGAGGAIGLEACARSAPDGYNLCTANNGSFSILPVIRPSLPFDTVKDFAPVFRFGTLESILIVHPSVPAQSAKELFELARARPDALSFSSIGVGSGGHLHLEWFKAKGMPMLHVPYKGGDAAMNAVIAGDVQVSLNAAGRVAPMVKAGKLRALAVDGDRASEFIPNVPSLVELGYDVNLRNWLGLFAPAGTPREVVQRINTDLNAQLKNPEVVAKFLHSQGVAAGGGSPEAFGEFLKRDRQMYESLIRGAGIKFPDQ
jgi:tripartite-type tricarboxylate transporter receptor subunit TctC